MSKVLDWAEDYPEAYYHGILVADIGVDEGRALPPLQIGELGAIARIGELIKDRDGVTTRDKKTGQV